MNELFKHYHDFQECIIKKIRFLNHEVDLEILINNIWEGDHIRKDLDKDKLVRLRFHIIQEVLLKNNFNKAIVNEPGRVNWGIDEINYAEIKNDENILAKYQNYDRKFHHINFNFFGDKSIDIVFAELKITEIENKEK